MTPPRTLALRERPGDWFFVCAFSFFFLSSWLSDIVPGLGIPIVPDSPNPLVQGVWLYAKDADPFLIANPYNLRISTLISAFVFGSFYPFLVYAFVTGANWIRIPALMYVSAMVYGMINFLWAEFMGPTPPTALAWFFAWNLPYLIVPLLLALRMHRVEPFSS